MTITVQVHEEDSHLAKILTQVSGGEEVIITRAGKPVARLIPIVEKRAKRVPGSAHGQIVIMPDFDDPLPDNILDAFEQ